MFQLILTIPVAANTTSFSILSNICQPHVWPLCLSPVGNVNNIPTMKFFTGISKNTHSQKLLCYHWLGVSGISRVMHCGILINVPYTNGRTKCHTLPGKSIVTGVKRLDVIPLTVIMLQSRLRLAVTNVKLWGNNKCNFVTEKSLWEMILLCKFQVWNAY